MNCSVCGKSLSPMDKKTICSGACRQRKSRNKLAAQRRAYDIGFQIDAFSKMLTEETISVSEARELLYAIWDRISAFNQNVSRLSAVEEAKADLLNKKRR